MNRRAFLKAAAGAGLMLLAGRRGLAAKPDRRPNFVIILADDLGCGDTSLYGGWIKTPRIDRMAREGVKFTGFLPGGCDYNSHKDWLDGTEVEEQKGYSTHIITT